MKKIFALLICLLCIGCGKEEKNITINIYNTKSEEEAQIVQKQTNEEIIDEYDDKTSKVETNYADESKSSKKLNSDSNNLSLCSKIVDSVKSKMNKIKVWYNENKDEIKEKSNEIIENGSQKVKKTKDKVENWYDENKDEIKKKSNDILEEEYETLKNAKDKVKNWYSENKDEIKEKTYDVISDASYDLKEAIDTAKEWYKNN